MRSVAGHRLGLKRIDRGADAVSVFGVDLGEECKLPLDDVLRHSLHGFGIVREEPLLLLRSRTDGTVARGCEKSSLPSR